MKERAKRKILVGSNDALLRSSILGLLSVELEYEVHLESNGAAIVAAAERHRFDLALISDDLQDCQPHTLCAAMSNVGFEQPIVLLSATGAESAVVRGLESGALDYITTPFNGAVLLARLRAHMRGVMPR